MITHHFSLFQGHRQHDTDFLLSSQSSANPHQSSVPTQHGDHLMRSRLETQWAQRFEAKGFVQAPYGIATPPCYFYEPRGMKRWPTYPAGHHYRIDFILVSEVETCLVDGVPRSKAVQWEWVSIKPAVDHADLSHLIALVTFDARHQRAFQCCGDPLGDVVYMITWRGSKAILTKK